MWDIESVAPLIPYLGVQIEVSGQFHAQVALSQVPLNRKLGGPLKRSCREPNQGFLVVQAVVCSLFGLICYRLNFTSD